MTSLSSRASSLHNPNDTDADKEESDAEEKKDSKSLHDWDLDGHDEGEGDGHEKYVGYDIADFVCVNPHISNDTAAIRSGSIWRKNSSIPCSWVGIDLPVQTDRGACEEYSDDGCNECCN